MNGLVSILIPCYNGEIFLKRCFECILNQSYKKIEVIFVNDGSTDKSEEIAKIYGKKLIKEGYIFKYIYISNGGAASAINQALKEVTGEYIMLYDVDDIIFENAVLEKVKFLENNKDYDMVRNNGYYVNNENIEVINGKFIDDNREKRNKNIFDDLILGNTNNWPASFMVRAKSLFDNIENRSIYISQFGQNLQIMLPVAYFGKSGFIDKPLMKYVRHDNSHSSYKDNKKRLKLINGYEENRVEIVKRLNISEQDKRIYIKKINVQYYKIKLNLAYEIKDKELMKEQYMNLINSGEISKSDKVLYKRGMNKIYNNLYRVYEFNIRAVNKVKRLVFR